MSPLGIVTFDVAGAPHALRFTINALCLLEDRAKLTQFEVAQELAFAKDTPLGVSATTLRALYWAGCDKGGLTLEQAGDLIDQLGKRVAVSHAIAAFDAAFPDAEASDGKDPPKESGEAAG